MKKPKRAKEILVGLLIITIMFTGGAAFLKTQRDAKISKFKEEQALAYSQISKATQELRTVSEKINQSIINDATEMQTIIAKMNEQNTIIKTQSDLMLKGIESIGDNSAKIQNLAVSILVLNKSTDANTSYYQKYQKSEAISSDSQQFKLETANALKNNNTIINNFNTMKVDYDQTIN
jgi:hypothetical protein